MKEVIWKLHEILNLIKGFTSGYASNALDDGKMLIEYNGRRFVLRIEKVERPSETFAMDVHRLRYL